MHSEPNQVKPVLRPRQQFMSIVLLEGKGGSCSSILTVINPPLFQQSNLEYMNCQE